MTLYLTQNSVMPMMTENTLTGKVVSFSANRKYGFLREENEETAENEQFFHFDNVKSGWEKPEDVKRGDRVTYNIGMVSNNTRPCAVNIEVIK